MSSTMKIIGFSGVLREESYNKAALRVAQDVMPLNTELEIVSIRELPASDTQGLAGESEAVRAFKAQLRAADAVLIAAPEYKGMLPRALHNVLACIARSGESALLAGKPVAIMGIGRQTGSERAHLTLRRSLADLGATVIDTPEVYVVSSGWEKVDHNDNVVDKTTRQRIRTLMSSLVAQTHEKNAMLIS